jgi:hypothetical protein
MPLDPKQCHKLLMADRTGDVVWIAAAIERLLASDPDIDLFEIEAAFREAAVHSYLIATAEGFEVVVGVQAMLDAVAAAGTTPEENRVALAGKPDVADGAALLHQNVGGPAD